MLDEISIDSEDLGIEEDFQLAWGNETGIGPELEMVFLVVDLQTIVNSIVVNPIRGRSIRVEGTLEVMRYLMRHELSIRPDFPRDHDLVSGARVTPLKNESSLSGCRLLRLPRPVVIASHLAGNIFHPTRIQSIIPRRIPIFEWSFVPPEAESRNLRRFPSLAFPFRFSRLRSPFP